MAYSFPSVVRGFYVYKNIWDPVQGETLTCVRETTNLHDPYAVAIVKNAVTVGHVPKKISTMCSIFLRNGGGIYCTVSGNRQHSGDLPQGGMEIPCILNFVSDDQSRANKISRLLKKVEQMMATIPTSNNNKRTLEDSEHENG
jgi:hypothetical protein